MFHKILFLGVEKMKRSMIFAKSQKSMIIKIMRVPYDLSEKNKILTYE